jgi:hypothetical protein
MEDDAKTSDFVGRGRGGDILSLRDAHCISKMMYRICFNFLTTKILFI